MNSKWLVTLLLLSIALNLALAGFIIGKQNSPHIGYDATRAFPGFVRSLPAPRREELRPIVRQQRKSLRKHSRLMRKHSLALREALVAQPFQREVLLDTLNNMQTTHHKLETINHTAFVTFVQNLSDDERIALADDMLQRRKGLRGEGRRRSGPRNMERAMDKRFDSKLDQTVESERDADSNDHTQLAPPSPAQPDAH